MSFTDWSTEPGVEVVPGDLVWMVTGDQLQVIRSEMAPGTDFGLHRHTQEQLICVLEGVLEFTVDGETRQVGPGGVIHAPSGVEHGGRVASQERVVTLEAFSPPRVDFDAGHDSVDMSDPK